MSMEDIEKLRTRVEKDPNSRLFLPLAEEYRKAGMLDEAITVILNGLERHPEYTSARVTLGKIYLEKSMTDEAQGEFEQVVSMIPDNLFAHRKLADIYRERGDTDRALKEYKKVLELNPLDEDVQVYVSEIEGLSMEPLVAPLPETGSQEAPADELEEFIASPSPEDEAVPGGYEETIDKDFEEFKNSFSVTEDEAVSGSPEMPERADSQYRDFPGPSLAEAASEPDTVTTVSPALPTAPPIKQTVVSMEEGMASADALIGDGHYYKALEIYREYLSKNPDDKRILQRAMELKSLMKLIGKGDDMLIANLEAFLAAVKTRASRPA